MKKWDYSRNGDGKIKGNNGEGEFNYGIFLWSGA
jgi:hypothetical protein